MIAFDFEKDCYSCGACKNVCPKDAIHYNKELLPIINLNLCIECGCCEKVCVKLQEKEFNTVFEDRVFGYVCKNRNQQERLLSSSGGIFILLAKEILSLGGYICGCVYDDNFMPSHIISNNIDDVYKMMGSKYVKSDVGLSIRKAKKFLEEGHPLLFTGVPCQTAAVKNCLGNYEKLYIASVVCHGSIERDFWDFYLEEEKKYGIIKNITMRDKSKGWDNYGLKFRFSDGKERISYRKQDGYFLKCFTSGYFERERCLRCKYKGSNIEGDILLGDGWGMEQLFPELTDSFGVSSIMVMTEKGRNIFAKIQDNIELRPVKVSEIIQKNRRIVSPAPDTLFRKRFQDNCRKSPSKLLEYCKDYASPSFPKKVVRKLFLLFRSLRSV